LTQEDKCRSCGAQWGNEYQVLDERANKDGEIVSDGSIELDRNANYVED
jgi:hypothetical protein